MGQVIISGGAGGGVTSDEVTATANRVVKGYTYVGSDTDDEIGTGTLELTGNATDPYVLTGNTYYSTDLHTKNTGTMVDRRVVDSTLGGINSNYPTVAIHKGTNLQMGTTVTSSEKLLAIQAPTGYYDGSYVGILASNLGDATAAHVYTGKTFTSASGIKLTGSMTVNSLTSFKVAVSSDRTVTLTWTVPTAATGKPYSGIHVRYSTSSAPSSITSGTAIYTNNGGVSTSGATATASVTMPAYATKYYFSAWSYATTSAGNVYSSTYKTSSCTTASTKSYTYKSSNTLTVPSGFKYLDAFCVGAGGGGGSITGCINTGGIAMGGGGAGGKTATTTNYSITSGQTLTLAIGTGGSAGSGSVGGTGGTTSVKIGSTTVCTADGGGGGYGGKGSTTSTQNKACYGGSGGSGGGAGRGNGGTLGGNGSAYSTSYGTGGSGQGRTTYAWGGSSGTKYSGGGGGGGYQNVRHDNDDESTCTGTNYYTTTGGAYGGGKGAVTQDDVNSGFHHRYSVISHAVAGTANSGGGGGGGTSRFTSEYGDYFAKAAAGGSGIILLKFHN